MKRAIIGNGLGILLFMALGGGCSNEYAGNDREQVEVVMNGNLLKSRKTRAQIVPENGLPKNQLDVGIVTVNFSTTDPANVQPDLDAWKGVTADYTRGYFGGPGLGAATITNGEIKYTNDDGTAVQKVFYDETGECYYVRVVYPHHNAEFTQADNGAAVVFNELNGTQDIMCSNLGWGNMDQPTMKTNYDTDPAIDTPGDSVIVFSHMLSLFRIKVVAENATAIVQYGNITNVKIIDQPNSVKVDMIDLAAEPYAFPETDFLIPEFQARPLTITPDSVGDIMVLPARNFTIEAQSENRLWLSADFNFATAEDPYATSAAGTIYEITLKFMEGYKMELDVIAAKEWWMDHEFN